jgi:hypothetical protein
MYGLNDVIDKSKLQRGYHMFVGTDTDGNMFTSFFDIDSGAPFIINYSK